MDNYADEDPAVNQCSLANSPDHYDIDIRNFKLLLQVTYYMCIDFMESRHF